MTFEEFIQSTQLDRIPSGLPTALQALWWDKRGDWQQAHRLVQDTNDVNSAWVHAYLHRKEGDLSNAHYWYRRANQPAFTADLHQEWQQMVQALLFDRTIENWG